MVHIRVHGETIGAFPMSDLPLDHSDREEEGATAAAAAEAVAGLVEVVSNTRHSSSRRNNSASRLPPVPRPVIVEAASSSPLLTPLSANKPYDYLLKFLLVGDSDVGKQEILNSLNVESTVSDMPFCAGPGKYLFNFNLFKEREINIMFMSFSAQSDNVIGGWTTSSSSIVGHFRPRSILHNPQIVFTWSAGSFTCLRFDQQVVLWRHRSLA